MRKDVYHFLDRTSDFATATNFCLINSYLLKIDQK